MTTIPIGTTATGTVIGLPLNLANRHGLITGATGTGKTCTLQVLAEGFSRAGVPVFAADIKGDLSGIAAPASSSAVRDAGATPVAFWDLFGEQGMPIRTSVEEMGPLLLARMLQLNDAQEGVLNIAFRWNPWGITVPLRDLHDLRARLSLMLDHAEDIGAHYGHVSSSSIAVIQRALLVLDVQGGHHLFGEPALNIADFMRTDAAGRGIVNLLHADRLMDTPKLYATFLLWLLSSLFNALPEAGDLAKPKLVFFFDEAHLLFADAPPRLLEVIERVVRLIRSKGVGVYFVTQSPQDVPEAVQAQLGHRIQHALRVFTPKDRRALKAVAEGLRPPPHLAAQPKAAIAWVSEQVMALGTGEALVSVLGHAAAPASSSAASGASEVRGAGAMRGAVPSPAERVKINAPAGQIGALSDFERDAKLRSDPLAPRYRELLDREAQFARFQDRLIAAGKMSPPEEAPPPPPRASWLQRVFGRAA